MRPVPRAGQARVIIGGRLCPMGILARAGKPPWALEAMLAADGDADVPVADWLGAVSGGPVALLAAAEWFRQNWAGDPAELSAAGVAAGLRADATAGDQEFLPAEGYAAVPARLAAGLRIKVGCAVAEVSWSPAQVEVTCDGTSVSGRAVVVTVPPQVVAAGRLSMPALPPRKRQAADALLPGDGCCAVLTIGTPAPETAVVFDADGTSGFVRCWQGRPEVLVVAKAAAAASVRAALTAGDSARAGLIGRALPWIRGAPVTITQVSDWGSDPWSGGAFAFPRAGALWAPGAWAEPVADTVFFAGEATCERPARVHGAMESGIRAAEEVLEVLRR
ncbi:MAG TPA: FAD-dependent oxidoreductase [Streptosporangiaceae bacterium]